LFGNLGKNKILNMENNNFKNTGTDIIIHPDVFNKQNCEIHGSHVAIDKGVYFSTNIKILFTSTSTTSAQIIEQKILQNELFKNRVIHQFLPIDSYFIVKKFLNYWKPRACIFVESEIWPNFIFYARIECHLSSF
jgi:hypothetical protein